MKAGRILSRKIGRAGSIKRDPSTLLAEVPRSAPHDEKQVLKWFLSKERLMGSLAAGRVQCGQNEQSSALG